MTNSVQIKPRMRAGTYNTFVRRYGPVRDSHDELLRYWNDPEILAADEHFVWTAVDADGKIYIMPGYATVNFMGRVLCTKPWSAAEIASPGYLY